MIRQVILLAALVVCQSAQAAVKDPIWMQYTAGAQRYEIEKNFAICDRYIDGAQTELVKVVQSKKQLTSATELKALSDFNDCFLNRQMRACQNYGSNTGAIAEKYQKENLNFAALSAAQQTVEAQKRLDAVKTMNSSMQTLMNTSYTNAENLLRIDEALAPSASFTKTARINVESTRSVRDRNK
ncbi:hypothetical protein BH11CYA1_BH11CYA1_30370 [soil metagenome]